MITIHEVYTDTLSCEPIVRRMPNGDLLCVCQCGGPTEPHPDNRVYTFRSRDNGTTWSEKESIYPERGVAVYCTEVWVHAGLVTAYLTLHTGRFLFWRCVMMQSADSGRTWREAGPPPFFPEYTFIRGTIALADQSMVTAYQYYPVPKEDRERVLFECYPDKSIWQTKTPYCESGVILRDRHGLPRAPVAACRMDMPEGWIWSEPTLIPCSDGSIAMLMRRCHSGWLWRCDSADGGLSWSMPTNTGIPNPSNKPKLLALGDGKIGLIHTPNNEQLSPGAGSERYPLALWISDDDMRSWRWKLSLADRRASYSYADGFYEKGHVLFTIERDRRTILFFDVELTTL